MTTIFWAKEDYMTAQVRVWFTCIKVGIWSPPPLTTFWLFLRDLYETDGSYIALKVSEASEFSEGKILKGIIIRSAKTTPERFP